MVGRWLFPFGKAMKGLFSGAKMVVLGSVAVWQSGKKMIQKYPKLWKSYEPGSKLLVLGMVIQPLMTGILIMGIFSPLLLGWVSHPLLYGNIGSWSTRSHIWNPSLFCRFQDAICWFFLELFQKGAWTLQILDQLHPKTPKGMSWGVKTTCLEAPGLSLGGSGVSIGGVRSLRAYVFSCCEKV